MCQKKIDFNYLQQILIEGIKQIEIDQSKNEAVLFLGDTGVGKSTLMTYLMGEKLTIEQIGLKPALFGPRQSKIKIGHEKYSQTSVPSKIVIQSKVFYDCPGFNDNKSQEYDIANSFYLQRLFQMFQKIKIVMVIDQSYLTETRAHRLPSLIKKLRQSFGSLHQIMDSLFLIINKCDPDFSEQQLKSQFIKVLQTNNIPDFAKEDRTFFKFILQKGQFFMFPAPTRQQIGTVVRKDYSQKIMRNIDQLHFMHGTRINNIISDDAKLAIRDYIDDLTFNTERYLRPLFEKLSLKNIRKGKYQNLYLIKQQIMKFQDLGEAMYEVNSFRQFLALSQQLIGEQIQQAKQIQQELKISQFFQKIYDKIISYYSNLANGILSGFSVLLLQIDRQIQVQKMQEQKIERQRKFAKQMEQQALLAQMQRTAILKQVPPISNLTDSQKTIPRKRNISMTQSVSTTWSKQNARCSDFIDERVKFIDKQRPMLVNKRFEQEQGKPLLKFKKRMIEADYRMKQLSSDANIFSAKIKIFQKNIHSFRA